MFILFILNIHRFSESSTSRTSLLNDQMRDFSIYSQEITIVDKFYTLCNKGINCGNASYSDLINLLHGYICLSRDSDLDNIKKTFNDGLIKDLMNLLLKKNHHNNLNKNYSQDNNTGIDHWCENTNSADVLIYQLINTIYINLAIVYSNNDDFENCYIIIQHISSLFFQFSNCNCESFRAIRNIFELIQIVDNELFTKELIEKISGDLRSEIKFCNAYMTNNLEYPVEYTRQIVCILHNSLTELLKPKENIFDYTLYRKLSDTEKKILKQFIFIICTTGF